MINSEIHALRLQPGQDLKKELESFVTRSRLRAGWILTCVGSLTQVHLRFANQSTGTIRKGYFEIVSLVGTLCPEGVHLHLCVADEQGMTTGGHLLDNNLIYTTAEIVIGETPSLEFKREEDASTGWRELVIRTLSNH